jgi:hypothetical protein
MCDKVLLSTLIMLTILYNMFCNEQIENTNYLQFNLGLENSYYLLNKSNITFLLKYSNNSMNNVELFYLDFDIQLNNNNNNIFINAKLSINKHLLITKIYDIETVTIIPDIYTYFLDKNNLMNYYNFKNNFIPDGLINNDNNDINSFIKDIYLLNDNDNIEINIYIPMKENMKNNIITIDNSYYKITIINEIYSKFINISSKIQVYY